MSGNLQSPSDGQPRASRLGTRFGLAPVALAFFASRLLVFGSIFLSRLEIIRGALWHPGDWLDVLANVDGSAWLEIARNLRLIGSAQLDPTVSCFPVYPLIVALVGIVSRDAAIAAVLISNLSLVASGCLLFRLVHLESGDAQAGRAAVFFLMFSPGAFFFSSATADAPFLLLAIGSLLAARTERWLLAGSLAVLGAATLNLGFLLAIPLVMEAALQMRRTQATERSSGGMQAAFAVLLGLQFIAVLLIGARAFGDPLALLRLSADSEATLARLINISTAFAENRSFWQFAFAGTVTAGVLLCAAAVWVKLRPSYVGFAAALLCACIVSHDFEAPRTMALAFPLCAAMAPLTRKLEWTYEATLLASAGLLAFVSVLVANGHWIT